MLVQWRRFILGLGLLAVIALASGCSGINASGSVSPATFLLPGLSETTPNATVPADEAAPALFVARAN
jgi:hypothetical protein